MSADPDSLTEPESYPHTDADYAAYFDTLVKSVLDRYRDTLVALAHSDACADCHGKSYAHVIAHAYASAPSERGIRRAGRGWSADDGQRLDEPEGGG